MWQLAEVKDNDNIVISYKLQVKNEADYELPNSGGMGIYWYMITGILLMIAAALILYKNKSKEVLMK